MNSPTLGYTERKSYYRSDIDGLRGLAVVCVVLYHLFPDFITNGFLGVDIFFVISGFVVTQSLIKNIDGGKALGLKMFYTHRMKRILPALYFNTIISIVLCLLLIPPNELGSIFKTAASSVVGLSNVALLYAGFDYFSPDLSLNPFVHTWSLGVEEQFYAIFPIVVVFATSIFYDKSRLKYLLFVATVISFIYWLYLGLDSSVVVAFYNPFARFWELLCGVLLYLFKDKIRNIKVAFILEVIVIMMFTVTLFYQVTWVNPILLNIIAVFFAAIIVVGAGDSVFCVLLKNRLLVYIGKISYSLYLWHFTVFVLFDWTIGLEHPFYIVVSLIIAVVVSIISYKYIETPFRFSTADFSKVVITTISAGSMLLLVILLSYSFLSNYIYLGDSQKYFKLWPSESQPLGLFLQASNRECHLEYRDNLSRDLFEKCRSTTKEGKVIFLIGNSHAQHLIPMLDDVSNKTGYGYTALTISGCRMVPAAKVIDGINFQYNLCKQYYEDSLDYVLSHSKPNDIVLFGGRSLLDKPAGSDWEDKSDLIVNGERLSSLDAYNYSIDKMTKLSSLLREKGVDLIFTGPTPIFEVSATQCMGEWFRLKKNGCSVGVDSLSNEMVLFNNNILTIKNYTQNAFAWFPHKILCNIKMCAQNIDDVQIYRDKHHLSLLGSKALSSSFIEFIEKL